jgi:hypothetical protein
VGELGEPALDRNLLVRSVIVRTGHGVSADRLETIADRSVQVAVTDDRSVRGRRYAFAELCCECAEADVMPLREGDANESKTAETARRT